MNAPFWREETRRQRTDKKLYNAEKLPLSVATVNFAVDDNVAYIIRSAACFGVRNIYIIGKLPERSGLYSKSGSLIDYMNIREFHSPSVFLQFVRENNEVLISAELMDSAENFNDFRYNFATKQCIVLGNENTGVPAEICNSSKVVQIPMIGFGPCLNTAHTGSIMLYEAQKQYREFNANRR